MRIVLACLVSALAAAGLAVAASTESGLTGTVHRACAADAACAAGPMRVTLVFTRGGVSRLVRTSRTGEYRVVLAPGTYRVSMLPRLGISAPRIRPRLVRVRAGRVDTLDFTVTTGLPD